MVQSIELLFDDDTEARIRRVWDDLAKAGVRSQAASNRPHVTLAVARHMSDGVDSVLRPMLSQLPLACRIGAPMLFGGGPYTLVRLVIPSAELLALHAEIYRLCLPHLAPAPMPVSEPGEWTPHVTLARRVDGAGLAQALAVRRVGHEIAGTVVGLRHWDGDRRIEHRIC